MPGCLLLKANWENAVLHACPHTQGANILTTKEGLVKLADFGVAAKVSCRLSTFSARSPLRESSAGHGRQPQAVLTVCSNAAGRGSA